MKKLLLAFYGLTVYVIFLAVVLYTVAFVGNFPQVPGIDTTGLGTPASAAIAIDVALLALFALQHSVMARPTFKRVWTRVVPPGRRDGSRSSPTSAPTSARTPTSS